MSTKSRRRAHALGFLLLVALLGLLAVTREPRRSADTTMSLASGEVTPAAPPLESSPAANPDPQMRTAPTVAIATPPKAKVPAPPDRVLSLRVTAIPTPTAQLPPTAVPVSTVVSVPTLIPTAVPVPTSLPTAVPASVPSSVQATGSAPPVATVGAPPQLQAHERRGQDAMQLVMFDLASIGYTVSFHPANPRYLGLTFTDRRHIEVYVRRSTSDAYLAYIIAHEIGHAVDHIRNDNADRAAWRAQRGMVAGLPWWPTNLDSDLSTPAGDFAECFASWSTGFNSHSAWGSCAPVMDQMAALAHG